MFGNNVQTDHQIIDAQSVTYLVCLSQLIFPDDPALPHKHSEMQGKFRSELGHSVICMSQSLQTKNEEAGSGFV